MPRWIISSVMSILLRSLHNQFSEDEILLRKTLTYPDCTWHSHLQNDHSYGPLSRNVSTRPMMSHFQYKRHHQARFLGFLARIVRCQEQIVENHIRVVDTRPEHRSFSIRRRKLSPIRCWCTPRPVLPFPCFPRWDEHSSFLMEVDERVPMHW